MKNARDCKKGKIILILPEEPFYKFCKYYFVINLMSFLMSLQESYIFGQNLNNTLLLAAI